MLAPWSTRVLTLIIDATPLKDRLVRLQVSLAYHGRAVSLSWRVYAARGLPAGTTWHWLRQVLAQPVPVPLHHRLPHLPTRHTPLLQATSASEA